MERDMKARKGGFKTAVNDALREHLGGAGRLPLRPPARDLGPAFVDLTKANQLAGDLDDEGIRRELALGR